MKSKFDQNSYNSSHFIIIIVIIIISTTATTTLWMDGLRQVPGVWTRHRMAETLKLVGKMGGTRVMEGGGGAGGVIEDRGSGTSRLAPPWRGFKESSPSS